MLTPQSYLPGGAGVGIGNIPASGGLTPFPVLGPHSYLPSSGGTLDPPVFNINNAPGMMPRPASLPSFGPPSMFPNSPMGPPSMGYPQQNSMSMMAPRTSPMPAYDPCFESCSRRPTRLSHRRRSRRCRPVIHVIDSDSCSTSSSCRSWSSCSRHRRRSRSCSRRRNATPPPQQPIIVVPIPCQQPAQTTASAPMINSAQPQQILLPPIHVQQGGQFLQQSAGIPSMQFQTLGRTMQPLQLKTSSIIPNLGTNPIIINGGSSSIQPSSSVQQISNIGQIQTIPANAIQYVQAVPQTSSPLHYVTNEKHASITPCHTLVNSTNKKPTSIMKSTQQPTSRKVQQTDLKYGRKPFDWYNNSDRDKIINENVHVATQ